MLKTLKSWWHSWRRRLVHNQEARYALIGLGLVVLSVIGARSLWYSVSEPNAMTENKTYYAQFSDVTGLHMATPVRVAGITIGAVSALDIQMNQNQAVIVEIRATEAIPIPDDSILAVRTEGFFGARYVEIIIGGSLDFLEDQGWFIYTNDAVDVFSLVERALTAAENRRAERAENTDDENIDDKGAKP